MVCCKICSTANESSRRQKGNYTGKREKIHREERKERQKDNHVSFLRKSSDKTEEFVPGKHDVPTIFSLPLKLYGRENETKQLLEVFADMERNVHSRAVFIR